MSHVTHMNESCHTHEWVMSHIWMSHVTHMNESCHTHEWVMSHTWMSHVTHINESCHTHEWVMSHTWMNMWLGQVANIVHMFEHAPFIHEDVQNYGCQPLAYWCVYMYISKHVSICLRVYPYILYVYESYIGREFAIFPQKRLVFPQKSPTKTGLCY